MLLLQVVTQMLFWCCFDYIVQTVFNRLIVCFVKDQLPFSMPRKYSQIENTLKNHDTSTSPYKQTNKRTYEHINKRTNTQTINQ